MRPEQTRLLPPRWVIVVGSAALIFHLLASLVAVLNYQSGPWPTPMGPSPVLPPPFVIHTAQVTLPYSRLIKMASSFHFNSNKQEAHEILFEANVKDKTGKVIARLRFPDPNANRWVRYRQQLMAQQLDNDEQLPPQQGVIIPPVGQQLTKQRWWQSTGEKTSKLIEDTPNAMPRGQPIYQPSALAYLAAQSYARYLCRVYQGDKTEIVWEWFDPVYPGVLLAPELPPEDRLSRFYASYGDLPK